LAFAVISGVPRADDLTDNELARIASRGLDDDEPPRRRGHVVDPPPGMTSEEWVARYAPPTDQR